MSITVIIPARAGSKGIPGKNIRMINGKPLIAWTIEQAMACKKISRIIVSTDSDEIASVATNYGADVPDLRPASLAQDITPTEPVLIHAIQNWCCLDEQDVVMLLQPTSPLRLSNSIDNAIETYNLKSADSLVSVCENHSFFWKNPDNPEALYNYNNRPRRQDITAENRWYRENGSIYLTNVKVLTNDHNRLGGKIAMYVMSECESFEIDSESDFLIVEELMRRNGL